MKNYFNQLKLQTKIVLLACLVFMLVITVENLNIVSIVNSNYYDDAVNRAQNVAQVVSVSPVVVESLLVPSKQNLAAIQAHTQMLSKIAQVEFIVVIDMMGIRQTHPDLAKIGLHVEGADTEDVLLGRSYISTAQGTLGVSLRAFQPVYVDGKQIGGVIVGIMSETIDLSSAKRNRPIFISLSIVLLIGMGLAVMLANSVKKVLYGLEPTEIAKLLEERNAILRTVREGIIAINRDGYLTLMNNEARRLLKIPDDGWNDYTSGGKHKIHDYIPNTRLQEVVKSGISEYDCEQKINDAVILTNRTPLIVSQQIVGAIATFRDMTEMRHLAEKLTGVNRYVDALRAQSHDFSNKLHVIHGLAYNNKRDELVRYLNEVIRSREKEEEQLYERIKDPVIAGFLESKLRQATELGCCPHLFTLGELAPIPDGQVTHSLVTIIGNLIDNALEAVDVVQEKNIDIYLKVDEKNFVLEVNDTGVGIKKEQLPFIFQKKYSTKGENRGYGLFLVWTLVQELHGELEVSSEPDMGMNISVTIPVKSIYGETHGN